MDAVNNMKSRPQSLGGEGHLDLAFCSRKNKNIIISHAGVESEAKDTP